MAVSVDGATRYNWPVSTGRRGYGTPSGVFRPQTMARRWFSRRYYNSPMPHSIFSITASPFTAPATSRGSAPRVAWLRPPASVACGDAVRAGRAQRTEQHAHRDFELIRVKKRAPQRRS
jgi:hypothetical protein